MKSSSTTMKAVITLSVALVLAMSFGCWRLEQDTNKFIKYLERPNEDTTFSYDLWGSALMRSVQRRVLRSDNYTVRRNFAYSRLLMKQVENPDEVPRVYYWTVHSLGISESDAVVTLARINALADYEVKWIPDYHGDRSELKDAAAKLPIGSHYIGRVLQKMDD